MRRTLSLLLALPVVIGTLGTSPTARTLPIPASQEAASAAPATLLPAPDPTSPAASDGQQALPPIPPAALVPGATGDTGPTLTNPGAAGPLAASLSAEGFLVAGDGSRAGTGPTWRYTVEIEPATGLVLEEVVAIVEQALHGSRSWARERTLVRVDDPKLARIRVVVATPETVDRLCARAGLRTVGIYSCWNGSIAALNAWRWDEGAAGFDDIALYRRYLVNHEFGHGLGYGHVECPAPGALAPVMMQQTMRLGGCMANGWPYPSGS